jgi:Flp pilus assembly CpaE family ATPase
MIEHPIETTPLDQQEDSDSATRILLVEDNPGDVRFVQELLAAQSIATFALTHAGSLGEAFARLKEGSFHAVLLDLSLPDSRGLDTLRRLREQEPTIPIVVLTGLADEAMAMRAITQGAQDYLLKGETDGSKLARQLRFAIGRQIGALARRLRSAIEWQLRAPARRLQAEQPRVCETLGILGCKGGVGASTIACCLAMALQSRTKEPVLLADLDFEAGVLDYLMEVRAEYSLRDAVRDADRLDAHLWNSLVCHRSPGLDVVRAPGSMLREAEIAPERLRQVLSFLRGSYRWIIADLGRGLNDRIADLLEAVDSIVLVTTPEPTALRQAKLMIQELKPEGRPEALRLVVNALPRGTSLTPRKLERMLGYPVWGVIPNIPKPRKSRKRPTPLPQAASMMKAVDALARELA